MTADDTRDIAIQVQRDLEHLTRAVDGLSDTVKLLHAEMQRREGAMKVGSVILSLGSGAVGAAMVKFGTWISAAPIK